MVTWVDSSKVSPSLIEEYGRSSYRNSLLSEQKYGVISHAVVSAYRIEGTSYPPSKRPKLKLQKIISEVPG